jgi:uncharacterized metal-binding protein YceD (DUF177 family)
MGGAPPDVEPWVVSASSEFVRKVVIEPWPEAGVALELRAAPEERAQLARRFGLSSLDELVATGRLERDPASGEIRLRGVLEAALAQECVVSLEPVPARLRQPLGRRWLRVEGQRLPAPEPELVSFGAAADEDEEVELVTGRTIDLGAAVAEELGLALDPYPRAAEADALLAGELAPYIGGGREPDEQPFAILRQLKEKRVR